jgi:hypothetical protein
MAFSTARLEFLPDDEEFATRRAAGEALTSPELAVLLAYGKISLLAELNECELSEDSWFERTLVDYFPPRDAHRLHEGISHSSAARRKSSTRLSPTELLNVGGITFVFRAIRGNRCDSRAGSTCRADCDGGLRHRRDVGVASMNWITRSPRVRKAHCNSRQDGY